MSQHDSLRERTEQHKPKNSKSKMDDKDVYKSMSNVMSYLQNKKEFLSYFNDCWTLEFSHEIEIKYMINFIKRKKVRNEFNYDFMDRSIIPDGGILYLVNTKTKEKFPLVIAEIKRQGTNKERFSEGKAKQATGNAIERLGKNLIGIRAMMNYEKITPFVCFGWGCDFAINTEETGTVRSKVVMMNEFYDLNKINVFKKDGNSDVNSFSPVSMFFREERWSVDEMFDIMKEIAETSIRYYLY
jgi:type II restriction enzyme